MDGSKPTLVNMQITATYQTAMTSPNGSYFVHEIYLFSCLCQTCHADYYPPSLHLEALKITSKSYASVFSWSIRAFIELTYVLSYNISIRKFLKHLPSVRDIFMYF